MLVCPNKVRSTESVSAMSPTRITHLIAGAEWDGTAERTSPVYNPATGEQTGVLDLATPQLVDEVVRGAKVAWENEWQHSTLTKRTQILFKFRELLNERKDEIAGLLPEPRIGASRALPDPLMQRLARQRGIARLVGVDPSVRSLEGAARRLHLDREGASLRELFGALGQQDGRRLLGFDQRLAERLRVVLDLGHEQAERRSVLPDLGLVGSQVVG